MTSASCCSSRRMFIGGMGLAPSLSNPSANCAVGLIKLS